MTVVAKIILSQGLFSSYSAFDLISSLDKQIISSCHEIWKISIFSSRLKVLIMVGLILNGGTNI